MHSGKIQKIVLFSSKNLTYQCNRIVGRNFDRKITLLLLLSLSPETTVSFFSCRYSQSSSRNHFCSCSMGVFHYFVKYQNIYVSRYLVFSELDKSYCEIYITISNFMSVSPCVHASIRLLVTLHHFVVFIVPGASSDYCYS